MSKLDFKTSLYLKINKAKIINDINNEIKVDDFNKNEVYVFDSYEDYKNYFKQYINDVDDDLIKLAILVRGRKGQVVALRGLCERIIIKKRTIEFYSSFDDRKVNEIHSRNMITPYEKVSECEGMDLCAPGDAIGSAAYRCRFFSDCHECLMEYFSHNNEYNKFEFKLINYFDNDKVLNRKK